MIPNVTELAQPEGASHGEHEIADLHAIAVAQRRGDQIGRGDRQHGHVGIGVLQDLRRMNEPAVGQADAMASGAALRTTCRLVST